VKRARFRAEESHAPRPKPIRETWWAFFVYPRRIGQGVPLYMLRPLVLTALPLNSRASPFAKSGKSP
jgi:hypothetical protein